MTGADPVAEALHRLRLQHPGWTVYRVYGPDWRGWAAFRSEPGDPDEELVTAPDLAQLECELAGR